MSWYPHVTVATIVEDQGRFLLVEEYADGNTLVFNQPAGHLEPNESLIDAALRETLEETGWTVQLQGIVGVGLYTAPNNTTYFRTTFFATPLRHDPERRLDTGIARAVWLSFEEIQALSARMRSPLVPKVIEQYLNGHRYPLSMIFG